VYRASGTLFLFLTLGSNDPSLDSECLGNARRRVCVFYRLGRLTISLAGWDWDNLTSLQVLDEYCPSVRHLHGKIGTTAGYFLYAGRTETEC
jgi:hypothetical protein